MIRIIRTEQEHLPPRPDRLIAYELSTLLSRDKFYVEPVQLLALRGVLVLGDIRSSLVVKQITVKAKSLAKS